MENTPTAYLLTLETEGEFYFLGVFTDMDLVMHITECFEWVHEDETTLRPKFDNEDGTWYLVRMLPFNDMLPVPEDLKEYL